MEVYISVYEKSMPDSIGLDEKLRICEISGFNGMEISVDESDERLARVLDKEVKREALSVLKSSGVPVKTMCLSGQRRFPFGSLKPEIRKKSLEIIKSAVDFSSEAGIRVIQIPGYDVWYEPRSSETEKYFAEGLFKGIEYASREGVTVSFETMENDFMNTVQKAMRYIELVKSPYLTVYPDLGNVRNGTDDYINDLKCGKGHISAVHLKDTGEGIFRDLELGDGRVDFVGCLKELLSQGVRLYNCEIWYDKKSDPKELLERNRRFAEKCFEEAVI